MTLFDHKTTDQCCDERGRKKLTEAAVHSQKTHFIDVDGVSFEAGDTVFLSVSGTSIRTTSMFVDFHWEQMTRRNVEFKQRAVCSTVKRIGCVEDNVVAL